MYGLLILVSVSLSALVNAIDNPEDFVNLLAGSFTDGNVFSTGNTDLPTATTELQRQLKQIGIDHNLIQSKDSQANSMLMLKTFITRECIEVEKHFTHHDQFPITQSLWVTPEIEVQLQNF